LDQQRCRSEIGILGPRNRRGSVPSKHAETERQLDHRVPIAVVVDVAVTAAVEHVRVADADEERPPLRVDGDAAPAPHAAEVLVAFDGIEDSDLPRPEDVDRGDPPVHTDPMCCRSVAVRGDHDVERVVDQAQPSPDVLGVVPLYGDRYRPTGLLGSGRKVECVEPTVAEMT
jgi:hypothetical protein